MEPNSTALRREFPVLERKTYLNSGSYCALANDVKAAFDAYMEDRLLVGADWDVWITKNESVRALTASRLHASPDEIAVTASVSAGLNALASALDFSGPRNKVVISDFEFPTNAQIWHAQEPRGARVVHVPRAADGYIPAESFAKAIDENTQLVAITHVCFRNGAKLDIPGIVKLAHAGSPRPARLLSIGGIARHRREGARPGFRRGGMLKYLLGTAGIGFLYARDTNIKSLVPTNTGWFAQAEIGAMDITANRPSPSARRFEAGTPPVMNCYAAEAGLKFLLAVGTPRHREAQLRVDAAMHAETSGDRLAQRDAGTGRAPRRHRGRAFARQRRAVQGTHEARHRHLAPRRQPQGQLSFLQQRRRREFLRRGDEGPARNLRSALT